MANTALSPLLRMMLRLLPGFLPLIVYVIVEETWGETTAILIAIGFGVAEFLFILIRERRADFLSVLDTLLLAAMGGISLALHDDAFFKIKPALLEAVIAVLVGISAFSNTNLLMGKSLQAIDTSRIPPEVLARRIKGMMRLFLLVLVAHIIVTVIAALWASKETWLFVSGPLLYILTGIVFLPSLAKALLLNRRAAQKKQ